MKKSPKLMICSVIGNFLVILNIQLCNIYFEEVRKQEDKCYFETGFWHPDDHERGDQCMKVWFNENILFYYLSEVNGLMLSSFSEFLAFLPYLLRSLRMQLMFKATDEYIKTDKMPKRQIRFWS